MSAPNNDYQGPGQQPPQLQPGQHPGGNGNGIFESLFGGDKKKFFIGAGVAVVGMMLLQNAFQDGVRTGIIIAQNGGDFPRGGYGYGPHIGPWFFILGIILFVAWRKGKFGNHGGFGGRSGPGGWMGGPGGRQPWRNSAPWGQPYPPTPPAAPSAPAQNWQETRVPVTPTPETQTNPAAAAAPTSPSSAGPDSPTSPQPMEYRRSAGAPDDQAPTVW